MASSSTLIPKRLARLQRELTDQEANAARFCRVFQDYTGLTLQERAELTLPIVDQDEILA